MAKKIKKGYEILVPWAKKLERPLNEIIKEVDEYKEKILSEHNNISEEEAIASAIGRYFASKKKHLTDIGVENVYIKIYCNTGPFDWVATKRAYALAEYQKDPDNAVQQGYVRLVYNDLNEVIDVIPRYYWAENREGKPNKKLGEDLPEHNYLWFMQGIGLLESELESGEFGKKVRKVEVSVPDSFANPKSKNFKQVISHQWLKTQLRVLADDKKTRTLYLEVKEPTDLTNVTDNKILSRLKESSVSKLFASQIITLENLKERFEKLIQWKQEHSRGTNKTYLASVFVVATDPGGDGISPSIAVISPEMGMIDENDEEVKPIKAWWKDSLPMDFGEGTKMQIYFRMKQNEIKVGDTYTKEWGDVTFDVQGFIMLLKTKREIDTQKPEEEPKPKGVSKIEPDLDEDIDDIDEEEDEEELDEESEEEEDLDDELDLTDLDELDEELMAEFSGEENFSDDELLS